MAMFGGNFPGKGGGMTPNQIPNSGQMDGGANPLAALFQNNGPTGAGVSPVTLPQIQAPQTPNIGMPPRPVQPPAQPAAPVNPLAAYMATLTGGKNIMVTNPTQARALISKGIQISPEIQALANVHGSDSMPVGNTMFRWNTSSAGRR